MPGQHQRRLILAPTPNPLCPTHRQLYQQEKAKLAGSRTAGSLRASTALPTPAARLRPPALQTHEAVLHAAMLPSPGSTNPSQLPSPSSPYYSQRTTPKDRPAHSLPDGSRAQRGSYGDEPHAAAARTPSGTRDAEERALQVGGAARCSGPGAALSSCRVAGSSR
jgi:hypothetical protein